MKDYCIIYDMDGVLIDSEPHYLKIGTTLVEEEGEYMTTRDFEKYVGTSSKQLWADIINTFNFNKTPDYFIDKSRKMVLDLIENDPSYPPHVPGVVEFLENFRHIQGGVASSTSLPLIEKCLTKAGLISYFQKLTSGHEVELSKPEPDVFLLAANRLGFSPSQCIVIEDSKNGVTAAKRAGMTCVGLINPNSGNQDLSLADIQVTTYTEASEYINTMLKK